MPAFIIGTGAFLPEPVVTNEDLAPSLGLAPDWIYRASGIRSRRWAPKGTRTSGLGAMALETALASARLPASAVDYLLFGTMTPDRYIPGSASAVQNQVALNEVPCLDIRAACCNMLYGLQLARALIDSGGACNVAICLAEVQSPWLKLTPEAGSISMLFGDGASALIVSKDLKPGALQVVDVVLQSDGRFVDELGIRSPGTEFGATNDSVVDDDFTPRMSGQQVILHASRKTVSACRSVLKRNGATIDDVHWIVPHQANANLLSQMARSLRFPRHDGMISVLEHYGNTSSASMGIALDVLIRSERVGAGDLLLMPAFGAGYTWGAALCRA